MGGLYQRALDYLQSNDHVRLVRPGEADHDALAGTADERAHIEAEIRRAVEQHRIRISPETFRIKPKRRGIRLPILVNVFAAVLIVAGAVLLNRIFDREEQTLVERTGSLASAEGRLLSALRQESADQISEKEREIAEIERRLAEVEAEREQIRSEAHARLETRESELRTKLEAELAAERSRLAAQNLTEPERIELLAMFREQRQSELEQQMELVQRDALVELQAREDTLAALAGEYGSILDATVAERDALEAQLIAEIRRREAELSGERAAATNRLDELRAEHDRRQLILDHILGFYRQVRESLAGGNYDDASRHLTSLREYLDSASFSSIPELARRRGVELFLVSSLEDRVERARAAGTVDTQSLVQSAAMISRVGTLIAAGDREHALGNVEQARALYVEAMHSIPAVQGGYTRLTGIDAGLAAEASARVEALIETGNELYRAGSYEGAIVAYEEALSTLPSPDEGLLARLLDSGHRVRAEGRIADQADEIAELRARLEQTSAGLRAERERTAELGGLVRETRTALDEMMREQSDLALRIEAYRSGFGSASEQYGSGPTSTLELLETKLLILRIVGSEPVESEYPDLADELHAYLDALIEEQRSGAAHAVLRELYHLLGDLTAPPDGSTRSAVGLPRSYPTLGSPEFAAATDQLLSRLGELLHR